MLWLRAKQRIRCGQSLSAKLAGERPAQAVCCNAKVVQRRLQVWANKRGRRDIGHGVNGAINESQVESAGVGIDLV